MKTNYFNEETLRLPESVKIFNIYKNQEIQLKNKDKQIDLSFIYNTNFYSNEYFIVYCRYKRNELIRYSNCIFLNYLTNMYYSNKREFYQKANSLFTREKIIKIVDGMELVDLRLNGNSLIELSNKIELLFIISKDNADGYKNYHLTINDVIRSRSFNNLTTIVFYEGSPKSASDYDYLFCNPTEINLLNRTQSKHISINSESSNFEEIDGVLVPKAKEDNNEK